MAMEIIELRGKLVERLKREAGMIGSEHDDKRLEKLVLVNRAIEALDFVMKAGGPEDPGEPHAFFVG